MGMPPLMCKVGALDLCKDSAKVCCRYISNTKIKFMLVLSEPIPKDDELRMVSPFVGTLLDREQLSADRRPHCIGIVVASCNQRPSIGSTSLPFPIRYY